MNDSVVKKVAIYGGNGFVGVEAAKQLNNAGHDVVCISRSGHKPVHLKDQAWSEKVRWCKGDANEPDMEFLKSVDVVVISIGSPPLPTFTKEAYDEQLFMNGTCCVNLIEAAELAGVTSLVLMSAQIPYPLRTNRFAYYRGKQLALLRAKQFTETSNLRNTFILKPGVITGKRTLPSGRSVRIDWMTAPISWALPWQFVSVFRVAQRIVNCVAGIDVSSTKPVIYNNKMI